MFKPLALGVIADGPLDRRPMSPGLREFASAATAYLALYVAYFSPVLLEGRILAPGDGLIFYVPALQRTWSAWVDNAYIGYPAFADIQYLTFSPLRLFGGHYNAAVLSAYVLASSFMYAYARWITGSRMAGALAGVVYGGSAFMIVHIGHFTIIHTAAWLPAMLWGLERLDHSGKPTDIAPLALIVALGFLGGHPQIFLYMGLLAVAYVVFLAAPKWSMHRPRAIAFLRHAFLAGSLGFALVAIQLFPLVELATFSSRTAMQYGEFTSFAMDPRNLLLLFAPNLWGSQSTFWPYYFGHWNLTELACYAGLPTLYLAACAGAGRGTNRYVLFWLATAVAALLYMLGPNTPIAALAYHTPGLNLFRAPARMAIVAISALAVLAAIGFQALGAAAQPLQLFRRATASMAAIGLVVLVAGWSSYPQIVQDAASGGIALPPLYANRAAVIPVVLALLACGVLYAYARWRTRAAGLALVALLVIDLGSFGWFYEWRDSSSASEPTQDADWARFAQQVRADHGRLLFVDETVASAPAQPNLNLLYELPIANGYGPLQLGSFGQVTGIETSGRWLVPRHPSVVLALLGVDWVAGGNVEHQFGMGGDCAGGPIHAGRRARVPKGSRATHVRLVSHLTCSTGVPDLTRVLELSFRSGEALAATVAVRAGIDTAEWAIERNDVARFIAHSLPRKREAFPANGFNGYWFESEFPLTADGRAVGVGELVLDWKLDATAGMVVRSIELEDRTNGTRIALNGADFVFGEAEGWISKPALPGVAWLRQNGNAFRAWSVAAVQTMNPAAIVAALAAGIVGGQRFDAHATALIEPDGDAQAPGRVLTKGAVTIREWNPGLVRIGVQAPGETFVVVSQTFYPGWRAQIDGAPAKLLRTDALLQGLFVPGGAHEVMLYFQSSSLIIGGAVSASAVLALLACVIAGVNRHRIRSKRGDDCVRRAARGNP